ncbi:MAG: hypothetical protein ACI9FG_001671 [Crocinitomicaceae bacterium]|jgi:hypothetical protein
MDKTMNTTTTTEVAETNSKTTLNIIVAVLLTVLGLWMTVADFSHQGDLIFQSSSSILISSLFVSALFLAGIVIAALPKRLVVGVNLLLLSRLAMGFPLNIWLDNTLASRVVTVAFLLISLAYLIVTLRRSEILRSRPWIQLKHTVIAVVAWVFIGILAIPILVTGYAYGTQNLLGRYTSITPAGVDLLETVFEKDGQKVHLVGMMHIGDGAYYSDLMERLNATPTSSRKRLVLTEGVSDRNKILPEDFAKGKTYERWAQLLGVESQKSLMSPAADTSTQFAEKSLPVDNPAITWQNADIDVSDFEEHHRDLLVEILTLMSSGDLAEMLSADTANFSGMEIEDLMMNGLILARNDILMKRFNEAGAGFEEIYIPWGAAHLPDIEKRLLAQGYQKTDETVRPVMKFWE